MMSWGRQLMQNTVLATILPVLLFAACVVLLAVALLAMGNFFNPRRPGRVKRMPYESGMDPIHDSRRRFDVRFHLLAIAFLVFDVELLFLYPWAVTARPAKLAASPPARAAGGEDAAPRPTPTAHATAAVLQRSAAGKRLVEERRLVFAGVMVFVALLTLGFVYDWRKGIFRWR
jgi:NADH-quinone oxidoreductase subunit A